MYDRHRVAAAIFAVFMKVVRGNLGPPHRYDEREVGYGARFEALAKSDLSMRPHAPVWLPAEPYTPVEIDSIMVSTVVGSSVDESVFSPIAYSKRIRSVMTMVRNTHCWIRVWGIKIHQIYLQHAKAPPLFYFMKTFLFAKGEISTLL